ncbi:MAG: PEP-CTERM sorting domain-containing protein [Pontiellaceae bacterium]|nr:PEP-CTERM sorting domain-containing protein [Pontiellaceae bacterium]MBN2785010.1 PEP-CTERM sorting domain-containing protein [Pontiellaceae bacterium]
MKKLLVCCSVAGALAMSANASSVTWSPRSSISGASDVSTDGTYFGSWAPYVELGGSALAVNGVTFANDLPGYSRSVVFQNSGSDFGDPGTGDANYNTLLGSAIYSDLGTGAGFNGSGCYFSWGGMTVGHEYQIQLWVEDTRNTGTRRWENIFGDEGPHGSEALDFPADGTGLGMYVIGTFTADAPTQTLNIEPWTNGGPQYGQVNLFQVRDLTVIPEPATLGLVGAFGVGALFIRRRLIM